MSTKPKAGSPDELSWLILEHGKIEFTPELAKMLLNKSGIKSKKKRIIKKAIKKELLSLLINFLNLKKNDHE